MKVLGGVLSVFGLMFMVHGQAYAYIDHIDAPAAEVYKAAENVFEQFEIKKKDPKDLMIKTQWEEGHSRISKRLAFIGSRISKTVELRSSFTFKAVPGSAYTEVEIKGDYQTRSTGDDRPWRRWDKDSGGREEYFKEKDLFFQVLAEIEQVRNPQSKPPEVSEEPTPVSTQE